MAHGNNPPVLKSQYNHPATLWESEALQLGNGFIGAMVFGDVATDVIQINEHSLWSGGPGKNPAYNGGHQGTPASAHQNLQQIRNTLQEKMSAFTANHTPYVNDEGQLVSADYEPENAVLKSNIKALMGDKTDFGSYQSLCNLNIAYPENVDCPAYTHYHRELNIDSAFIRINYTQNAINYKREYFVSYPDNALIIKLSSDRPKTISRTIWLTTPQTESEITASAGGTITLTGQPADQQANGLKFAQFLRVKTNGKISVSDQKLVITNADEMVIILSAATNYQQCMDNTFNYFSTGYPLQKAEKAVNASEGKTFENIFKTHIADYQSLYNRMKINLKDAANPDGKTTDQLLAGYKDYSNTEAENLYLEQLYFQFGRYLLISSSRPHGLPANLQGIWAEGLTPPWAADYHTNINIQMNYWLAEPTNLSECHLPVMDYINGLVPRGKSTANHYYCKPDGSAVRGWVIHHENNVWGNTAPGVWYEGFYFPAAAGWMCQDIWEHFQFTQDMDFLQANFQTMLDAALFWVDNLWLDTRDETLVANPSYSPEHGQYSLGASCDQAIITELFDMVLKAGDILPHSAGFNAEIEEIRQAKNCLAGPKIGLNGQLMEWKDETTFDITGDGKHRHVNHLFWLHPGSQIIPGRSAQDNLYAEAMKKTLNTRGDGGTGWSKAWKINFWARLRNGNHSHKLLEELLKESTLNNLFDTHPPFQIDGNLGATAGMTEMLVQSQGEYIEILPALPDQWHTGSFNGIKARGNFELNARWENKTLKKLEITSLSGKECNLKYNGIYISFPTETGKKYVLDRNLNID
ncbi:hypothetical protein FACS189413_13060 [Bacteroidia bacterium]|nr:hypothetical protein FACS189413_13060 [Bacteroidia bacterium]